MLFKEHALNAAELLSYEPYRKILFHIRKKSATPKRWYLKKSFHVKMDPL
jgi:hypothetical protein